MSYITELERRVKLNELDKMERHNAGVSMTRTATYEEVNIFNGKPNRYYRVIVTRTETRGKPSAMRYRKLTIVSYARTLTIAKRMCRQWVKKEKS